MKQTPATSAPARPRRRCPHQHRELRGGRTGQQVDGGDRVLEVAGGDPAATLHAQLAQQRDVRGRAAEADAPDPPPLARDRRQRRGHAAHPMADVRAAVRVHKNS